MHPLYKKRDESGDDEETAPTYGLQSPSTGAWELGAYYEAVLPYKIHIQGNRLLKPPVILPVGHKMLAHRAHYRSWGGLVDGKRREPTPMVRLVCFDPRFPTDENQFLFVDMIIDDRKTLTNIPFKMVESPLIALALAASGLA